MMNIFLNQVSNRVMHRRLELATDALAALELDPERPADEVSRNALDVFYVDGQWRRRPNFYPNNGKNTGLEPDE